MHTDISSPGPLASDTEANFSLRRLCDCLNCSISTRPVNHQPAKCSPRLAERLVRAPSVALVTEIVGVSPSASAADGGAPRLVARPPPSPRAVSVSIPPPNVALRSLSSGPARPYYPAIPCCRWHLVARMDACPKISEGRGGGGVNTVFQG